MCNRKVEEEEKERRRKILYILPVDPSLTSLLQACPTLAWSLEEPWRADREEPASWRWTTHSSSTVSSHGEGSRAELLYSQAIPHIKHTDIAHCNEATLTPPTLWCPERTQWQSKPPLPDPVILNLTNPDLVIFMYPVYLIKSFSLEP